MTLSSGYKFLEELPLTDLEKYKEHRRLTVFYNKGLDCSNPDCERIGARLIKGLDRGGNVHVDVYTDDLVLMTVDHIIPRAKGGGEELENKQPMCRDCNTKKSDKIETKYIKDDNPSAVA
jgi:5-methylcytosine-specific restriction endonuclease McrA